MMRKVTDGRGERTVVLWYSVCAFQK